MINLQSSTVLKTILAIIARQPSRLVFLFSLIALIYHPTIFADAKSEYRAPETVKNVILFIGDGMGIGQRKAANLSRYGKERGLLMDQLPVQGFIRTSSANRKITDSAAAATAFSIGVKTNKGTVGLDSDGQARPTLLEMAHARGKSTGLVTTVAITHATPAAFAAHVTSRRMQEEIAEQMLNSGADVLLGGGEDLFLPNTETGCFPGVGRRDRNSNLISKARQHGYHYICSQQELLNLKPEISLKLLGLFGDDEMIRPFIPSLAEMTDKAIQILSMNPNGFFLMVEGGQIDWACHDNDARNAILDTIDLDDAISVALDFYRVTPGTLIIVTADHETGGMNVSRDTDNSGQRNSSFVNPVGDPYSVSWTSDYHTAADVPISAVGMFSSRLANTHENTYLFDVISQAMGLQTSEIKVEASDPH